MPAATDAVWVDVLPSMNKFGPAMAKGAAPAGASAGQVAGVSFGKAALAATAVVAGGAALATRALYNIGETFQGVEDTIRVGTGATGDALKGLTDSAKVVGTQVPADFEDVGTAIADINTRLGLTGEPLEEMSTKFLELSRITGTDLQGNIAGITRVFGDWDIATGDQAETMDQLFRASQASGAGVDELSDQVVQFGAPLRQLGFGFEESIALLAGFEKEGVNTSQVMSGMRQSLGRMAQAGEEPAEAFHRISEEIKNAGSQGEANSIAMELFGTRAGPDMAAAIREGRLELGDMVDAIENGSDTIEDAGQDTMNFSEQWQMFKNRVMVDLAPVAERVFGAITTGMTWIADHGIPTIRTFGEWVQRNAGWLAPLAVALGTVVGAIAAWSAATAVLNGVLALKNALLLANPIGLVVLAIVGLVAAIVTAYQTSDTFRAIVTAAWDGVKAAVEAVVNWFTGTAWPAIKGVWDAIANGALWLWNSVLQPAWEGIRLAVQVAIELIKLYWENVLQPAWNAVAAAARWLWNEVLSPVFSWIGERWQEMVAGIQAVWNGALKPAWEAVASAARWLWNEVLSPVFSWIGERWDSLSTSMRAVWQDVIRPVFEGVASAVGTMRDAVGRAVDAVGRAWDGLRTAFARPVNWVIDNVLNRFIGWVNDIADSMNLSISLRLVPNVASGGAEGRWGGGVYGRNKGGPIPGGGPDRDSVWLHATPGEHVWSRSEVQAAGGHGAVEALRRQALGGDDVAPIGGPMAWLSSVATSALHSVRDLIADTVRPAFDAVMGLMDRTVGQWGYPGEFAAGTARTLGDGILDWIGAIESEADSRAPDLGSGYQSLIDFMQAAGVGHVVTSTIRRGDSGYHGRGKAADFSIGGHGNRGYGHSGLRAIFDAFLPVQEQLAELILAGAPYNIKNGRQVGGYAWGRPGERGNHWNHVHAAVFDQGGMLPPGVSQVANYTGRPEAVLTDSQWRTLAEAAHSEIPEELTLIVEGEPITARFKQLTAAHARGRALRMGQR